MVFSAIDFETATGYRHSACAVGIVSVENGRVADKYYTLIQPPENFYRRKGFRPCRLSDCCCRMGVELNHHEALSDALACARLYILAGKS